MYNRYIPKNDGTYRRHSTPENPPKPVEVAPSCPKSTEPQQQTPLYKPQASGKPIGFLKNLLPKDFDTGDLMIVLLLLLMAGDCEDENNTALLTLALYFFL